MTWALNFDGVNDYASFNNYSFSSNVDITLDIIFNAGQSGFSFVLNGYTSGNAGRFYFGSDSSGSVLSMRVGGVVATFGAIDFDVRKTYKIEKRGMDWEIFEGSTSLGSLTAVSEPLAIRSFGYDEGVSYAVAMQLISAQFVDIDATIPDRFYSATLSNHSAGTPILAETISSDDATGYGMPTDGSAWIDLGGEPSGYNFWYNQNFTEVISNA